MSGKADRSGRSLAPAVPGERASRGWSSEWILSSLSLLLAATLAGAAPAGPAIPPAVLAPVESSLRAVCGCRPFAVRWSIPAAVAAGASRLDSLSAVADLAAWNGRPGGDDKSPAASADRVPVRLRGWRGGRAVEYLAEAEPLCRDTLIMVRRPVRAGTVLQADDLERRDGWFAPSAVRGSPAVVEGKEARHALAPGRPLHCAELQDPALVRRGAAVRVLCHLGAIAIVGRGVARADGCRGEEVGVRLAGAAKDCRGVVVGPGEVQVDAQGGAW